MPRGGHRPGAGRKRGSPSRRHRESKEILARSIEIAQKTNGLPHEIMYQAATTGKLGGETLSQSMRVDCLKNAAPYYAPRLATLNVDHSGSVAHRHQHTISITKFDVARRLAFIAERRYQEAIKQLPVLREADKQALKRRLLNELLTEKNLPALPDIPSGSDALEGPVAYTPGQDASTQAVSASTAEDSEDVEEKPYYYGPEQR